MTNAYVMTGTLKDGNIVQLDERLPVSSGAVRVTVEVITSAVPKPVSREVLERIWAEQKARGQVPPTAEEVAARVREVRAGWDD